MDSLETMRAVYTPDLTYSVCVKQNKNKGRILPVSLNAFDKEGKPLSLQHLIISSTENTEAWKKSLSLHDCKLSWPAFHQVLSNVNHVNYTTLQFWRQR